MKEFQPIERIKELCQERNWSYYKLAKASDITYSTLNTMLNKQNLPSLHTLQKICAGFGISMAEFFDPFYMQAGLTNEQSQCLELFTVLDNHEKQLALTYMKGLAKKL